MARNGFPGGMGGGNMQQLMRQAQKMQQDMARTQQEISEREFTATVGGGVVSATVLGTKELKAITIDPACVDADDVESLMKRPCTHVYIIVSGYLITMSPTSIAWKPTSCHAIPGILA